MGRIIAVVFAFILLAAHLAHHHLMILGVVSLFLPFLFLIKKRWVLTFLEIVLYLATISWIIPIFGVVKERIAAGEPYTRYLVIMITVTVYTFVSALLLRSKKLRENYK